MDTAFQADAFQSDAFQVGGPVPSAVVDPDGVRRPHDQPDEEPSNDDEFFLWFT